MSRQSRLLVVLAVMLAMLPMLALSERPAEAQAAANNWFTSALPNFNSSNLYPSIDGGSIAQVGCSRYRTGTETTGPFVYTYDTLDGASENNLSGVFKEHIVQCDSGAEDGEGSVIGADGTLYTVQNNITTYESTLVASKNGVVQWSIQLPVAPDCGMRPSALKLHIGADQDLYFMAGGLDYSCDYKAYLYGMEADTGTVKFEVPFTREGTYQLGVHSTGLAVSEGNFGQNFRFFDYSGVEDPQKAFAPTLGTDRYLTHWAMQPNGTMYMVLERNNDATCAGGSQVAYAVVSRNLQGVETTYDVYGYCKRTSHLRLTPDGGAVLLASEYGWNYGNEALIYVKPDGSTSMVDANRQSMEPWNDRYMDTHVDMHGNVLTMQEVEKDLFFTLFGSDGSVLAEYSTNSLRTSAYDEFLVQDNVTAIANGSLYAAVCFQDQNDSCSSNSSYHKVLRVGFAELDFAYPETAILGYQAQPVETLDYVALGDSFSSGEGVEPFDEATNSDGSAPGPPENYCHRSVHAYAQLLNADPAVSLNLAPDGFVACSGATTQNVLNGGLWNEPSQLGALTSETDVVTITVGGNDAGFEAFARKCFEPGINDNECDVNSQEFQDAETHINGPLLGELKSTYEAILAEEGNDAEVYVVGYPYIIPPSDQPDDFLTCTYLSPNEGTASRIIVDGMNARAHAAVNEINIPRLHFVDPTAPGSPFLGHEICGSDSYFNGATVFPDYRYSYHPNAAGQQAYASLLKGAKN